MLDSDLAALYGVSTKRLNEAVMRNARRLPADFMFRLTRVEAEATTRRDPVDELERKYKHHDTVIAAMLTAIRELMKPPVTKRRGIGLRRRWINRAEPPN